MTPHHQGATSTSTGQPRVLIVDDQELIRTGYSKIIAAAGIEVVAEAADGDAAVDLARRLHPNVVLMDIRMPTLDGLRATEMILTHDPRCRIIMLTTFNLDRYVFQALRMGASGFLLKDVTPEYLITAIRSVHAGDALLSPAITRRLVERFHDTGHRATTTDPASRRIAALTPRELEVLTLIGRGLSNAELAEHLFLSQATVKTHVARIFSKLGLRDRAQAVVLAYEYRLVEPGQVHHSHQQPDHTM